MIHRPKLVVMGVSKFAGFTFVFVLLCCHASFTNALLYMDIFPETSRCVGQELDEKDSAVFTFGAEHVSDGTYAANVIAAHKDIQKITSSLYDPNGNILMSDEVLLINSQRPLEKVFSSVEHRGVYKLCFKLEGGEIPVRASFVIDFKAKDARGSLKTASTTLEEGDVPVAETKLQFAEETLHAIHKEIEYAKAQELSLRESSEAVNERIQWFSLASMAILVVTSLWQLLYLRSFFSAKKVQ